LPGNRLRIPMIKPVWMLRKDVGGEFLHRPLQLRTLTTRKLAKLLDVSCTPQQLQEAVQYLPAPLRMDIFKRIMSNNDKVRSRMAVKENVFHAWLALFSGADLTLEEFLGDHWSHLVFQHLVKEQTSLPHVTNLALASREVNQERLCFLFELTESTWKPQLQVFLSCLPNLTRLTLSDFCDDDTVAIVGKTCSCLAYLSISLGPESFSEQQLSDDGFADLIESQRLRSCSLREVDLSNCFTSAVTAKTILNFSKLESVTRLHVMWSHFLWIDLSIRFLGVDFEQNHFVKVLSIKFGHDSFENLRHFNTDQGAIGFVSKVFPDLEELRLLNMFEFETPEEVDNLRSKYGKIVKVVNMQKCRNLDQLAVMLPNVEKMELGIVMNPDAPSIPFPCLTQLTISKDMFAMDFEFVHDLLACCVSISTFKVFSLKLANYKEEKLLNLFHSKPHIQRLRDLEFNFRTSAPITDAILHWLVVHCPRLERLGNLLSWNLGNLNRNLIEEAGGVLVLAKKSHWSLPWR